MAATDDLTKRATSGQLTDAERASAWRVFLGAATDVNYKKLKDDSRTQKIFRKTKLFRINSLKTI